MSEPGKILICLALHNFRDEEYEIPKQIFEKENYEVKTVSTNRGEAIGRYGLKTWIDYPFVEINPSDYKAIVFVGGGGAETFFSDSEVLNLARDFAKEDKITAAICIAPTILANAGLLEGKKATAYISQKERLESKGAIFTGKKVEVDGKIITANGPEVAEEFGEKIVEALSSRG